MKGDKAAAAGSQMKGDKAASRPCGDCGDQQPNRNRAGRQMKGDFTTSYSIPILYVLNSPALQQLHFVYFLIRNCLTITFFALGPTIV